MNRASQSIRILQLTPKTALDIMISSAINDGLTKNTQTYPKLFEHIQIGHALSLTAHQSFGSHESAQQQHMDFVI
jgi:hypothetical protein